MIYGSAIEIEDIRSFNGCPHRYLAAKSIFTQREMEYCCGFSSSGEHFAVRKAAKNAILKSLGKAGRGVRVNEIEIINDAEGAPSVLLKNRCLGEKFSIFLSLSHSGENAIAYSIVKKKRVLG